MVIFKIDSKDKYDYLFFFQRFRFIFEINKDKMNEYTNKHFIISILR